MDRNEREQGQPETERYPLRRWHCYYLLMSCAGFVLAGGRSSRMGRDKALLPWNGRTLLEHVAEVVRAAAGNVTVIGHEVYRSLGLTVIPDAIPDCGPLGGLLTAFQATTGDRVLLVACDMPEVTVGLLQGLISGTGDAVVAESGGRLHPLCAVYHRRLLPEVQAAVHGRSLKMHDFLSHIEVQRWPVSDANLLINMNAPGGPARVSNHYIEFAHVYKTFDRPVLVDVSFHVDPGETLAIIGRSGVGKSVSLGHIMGFIKPDQGEIFVSGENHHEDVGSRTAPDA